MDEPLTEAVSRETSSELSSRHSAYGALRWVLTASIVQRIVSIGCLAVIARLLPSKDEYGVFRELLSLHLICFVLLPLGFDQLYVREITERSRYAKLLRAAILLSAAATGLLIYVFHSWIAGSLNLRSYSWLLYTFPVALLIQAGKIPYKCRLAADLNFRMISMGEFANTAVTMAGGALLLVWWRSPAALYLAYAAGEVAEFMVLRGKTRHSLVRIADNFSELRTLTPSEWRFAALASGDQLLNAISTNAPVLVLGGALSHESAASYSMANSLVTMPLFLLVGALARIALPSLAGRDERDLQERTLEILAGAAAYIVPVLIGAAIFAKPIVHILLGLSWIGQTTQFVQWLVLYCIFVALFSGISTLDVIRDRMDIGFAWNLVTFVARIAALAWGKQYGVVQAVAAYSVVSAVLWMLNGFVLGWLLRCGMWKFHSVWMKFIPMWVGLAAACLLCSHEFAAHPLIALLSGIGPAALYIVGVQVFYPQTAKLLTRLVLSRKVQGALAMLRRGESTDLPTGGTGASIP